MLTPSIGFWGMPLTVSGLVSLLLLATVGQDSHGDGLVNGILSGSPFLLTYAYMRIFRNGRRPHMDRDLLYSVIYGRSVSPEPPVRQPVHPVLGRIPRGGK